MAATGLASEALSPDSTLIIGAGVAGLFTALKLAPRPVTVITAAPLGRGGSSTWAQGGLAAAMGADDSADLHFQDTIAAGDGLVEEAPGRVLVEEGPARVEDLIRFGVAFDRAEDGTLKLGREAAHNRNRIVHATGDQAGAAIMAALTEAALKADHITIRERLVAEDFIVSEHGRVAGVLAWDIENSVRIVITCPRTVLATGGLGGLFAATTNPVRAQGHGLSMALRAGAEIIDPEFVQFHPTAIDVGADPAPLATEALRGEGAHLVDKVGFRFMKRHHDDMELAPRDIVARGVAKSIREGNGAFLDCTKAIGERFPEMFPTVYAACRLHDINPVTDPIPVTPAAHYHMGGVGTDLDGRTTAEGLWAVGEVASTGVHGANRLASNSLLEALVFGHRAAESLKTDQPAAERAELILPQDRLGLPPLPAPDDTMTSLRHTVSGAAGILRNRGDLRTALDQVGQMEAGDGMTSGLMNALLAATLILAGAEAREESRGSHYRLDHQGQDQPQHLVFRIDPSAGFLMESRPVTTPTEKVTA